MDTNERINRIQDYLVSTDWDDKAWCLGDITKFAGVAAVNHDIPDEKVQRIMVYAALVRLMASGYVVKMAIGSRRGEILKRQRFRLFKKPTVLDKLVVEAAIDSA